MNNGFNLTERQGKQLREFTKKNRRGISETVRLALMNYGAISRDYEAPKKVVKKVKTTYYCIPNDENVQLILPIVCSVLGTHSKLVYCSRRRRAEATARHCLRYYLMNICGYTSIKTGYLTNRSDHATVLHSKTTWSNWTETDPKIQRLDDRIRAKINAAITI